MKADKAESRKAVFLTAYRALCEEHGLFVIWVEEEDYSAFTVAEMDRETFEASLQEMLIEPLASVRTYDGETHE